MAIQVFCILVACENVALNWTPFFALRRRVARLFGINLSKGVAVHSPVRFLDLGKLSVGIGTTISFGCMLDNRRGISIGNNVAIAHCSSIYTLGHDVDAVGFCGQGGCLSSLRMTCACSHIRWLCPESVSVAALSFIPAPLSPRMFPPMPLSAEIQPGFCGTALVN